jgi:predicted DNA-binding protein with PD1-like motif
MAAGVLQFLPEDEMQSSVIQTSGPKTFAVIFEIGDEVASRLAEFAKRQHLRASHFTAVGAFRDVTLGYFNWDTKQYERIPVHEQVEVLSLIGDVALEDGVPKVHAHVVVGKKDGTAHGGHLLEAHVRPTLEVMLTETEGQLRKSYDPLSKLQLIDPAADGAEGQK